MAKSGKPQDAAIAALSAVEEALNLGDESTAEAVTEPGEKAAPPADRGAKPADPADAEGKSRSKPASGFNFSLPPRRQEARETAREPARPPEPAPAAPNRAAAKPPVAPAGAPANDDRQTIGQLRQALQVRPSAAILGYTFASIAAWAILWTLFVYFNQGDILDRENGTFLAPKPVLTLLALLAPIVFIFVTGVMARRAHEM